MVALAFSHFGTRRQAGEGRHPVAAARAELAGTALGLTLPQTYRHVLLPMAFRIILPPLTTEFLNVIKNSAVALTIGLMELTARARSMQEFSFQVFEAFTAATLMYLLINAVVVVGMRGVESRGGRAGLWRQGGVGDAMFESFDFDVIARSWQVLIFQGLAFTAQVTLLAMVGGIVFGTLLAMMRLSSIKPLAWVAGGYVNLLRSIPLVLVIFWFYFLVPYIGAWIIGSPTPVRMGAFTSALMTFILFEACYYCEIMRAGIQSIPSGQVDAGYALGLNYWTTGQVVLPQAFRNMTPVLPTQTIVLFQDVSLVYIISLPDFVTIASKIAQRDGRLVEMYLFVAVVYFAICLFLSFWVKRLQARIAIAR